MSEIIDLEKLPLNYELKLVRLNDAAIRAVWGPSGRGALGSFAALPGDYVLPQFHCVIVARTLCADCGAFHETVWHKGHGHTATEALAEACASVTAMLLS